MSRFNRHIILFFLIFLIRTVAFCVEVTDTLALSGAATEPATFKEYGLRKPEEHFMDAFLQDPDFKYFMKARETPGWWQQLEAWIMRHLFRRHSLEAPEGLGFVLNILALLLLAFLIYKFIQGKYWKKFSFRRSERAEDTNLVAQQVNTVSYPALIRQALLSRDYILALRIQYWYILYLMDERGIIRNEVYKTNLSYYYEIREDRLKQGFIRVSRVFDCICYGEFKVDEALYQELHEEFNKFQEEVEK